MIGILNIHRSYNTDETLRDPLFFEIHINWDTGGRPAQNPEEIHFVGEIEDIEFILTRDKTDFIFRIAPVNYRCIFGF